MQSKGGSRLDRPMCAHDRSSRSAPHPGPIEYNGRRCHDAPSVECCLCIGPQIDRSQPDGLGSSSSGHRAHDECHVWGERHKGARESELEAVARVVRSIRSKRRRNGHTHGGRHSFGPCSVSIRLLGWLWRRFSLRSVDRIKEAWRGGLEDRPVGYSRRGERRGEREQQPEKG